MKSRNVFLVALLGVIFIFTGYTTLQKAKKPMLAHVVYFWAKPDLSAEDKTKFEAGLNSLLKIKTIKTGYIGKPAATESRDVIDSSYQYSLILFFDDVAGEKAYQIDPIHLAFVENNKQYWTKVIVYDTQTYIGK